LVMNLFHLCQNKIKLRVQRLQFVNNNLKINNTVVKVIHREWKSEQ
jgi:hypothetical protein